MAVPPRLNLLTLACRDVERMARFCRDLGWPEAPSSDEHYRVFQLENGVVLALWAVENYVPALGEPGDGFRGFTLGINVGSPQELERVHAALARVDGVTDLEEVGRAEWGGGFTFRDPEGNVWEVAFAAGSSVAADGSLTWF